MKLEKTFAKFSHGRLLIFSCNNDHTFSIHNEWDHFFEDCVKKNGSKQLDIIKKSVRCVVVPVVRISYCLFSWIWCNKVHAGGNSF